MPSLALVEPQLPREGVLTKAVIRAAYILAIDDLDLARILSASPYRIANWRDGERTIEIESETYSSAVLFVRLFRSLDAIVGGNEAVARAWIRCENNALEAVPLEKIQNAVGLNDVVEYLDAKRAIV